MKKTFLTTLLVSSLMTLPAIAAKIPSDGVADARIKTFSYRDNDVFRITGHYGYSTVIEFADGENIETISIGDSESWQIHKPKRGNLLLIKPLEENAMTNMTVITNVRMYSFEMNAYLTPSHTSPEISYRIRFIYPELDDLALSDMGGFTKSTYPEPNNGLSQSSYGPSLLPLSNSNVNFEYAYSGSETMRPLRAFDDGRFTYFQFPDTTRTPAIFTVDQNGNEALVNYSHEGAYIVVETLSKQFTLRDGDLHTCIFNKAYPETEFDGFSPRALEADDSNVPHIEKSRFLNISTNTDYKLNN